MRCRYTTPPLRPPELPGQGTPSVAGTPAAAGTALAGETQAAFEDLLPALDLPDSIDITYLAAATPVPIATAR